MSSDLTRWEKEARQNYVKIVFPDKKEYWYYSNLRDLILFVLQSCTFSRENPKTGRIEKFQDLSQLSSETRVFLSYYQYLVDKCRAEHDEDDLRVYGYIYVLQAMRDDPNFLSQYQELQVVLQGRISGCDKLINPAEDILHKEEWRIVLYEHPGLINKCAKPSKYLQYLACRGAPWALKYIDEPDAEVVDDLCIHTRRAKDSVRNILFVKPQFRPLRSEIEALIHGILSLSQINKKRLVEHDYNNDGDYWSEMTLEDLVKKVEEQRRCLTKEELETFRLNAVGWKDNIHAIKYMYDNTKTGKPIIYKDLNGVHIINPSSPGERVERKAIINHPDNIGDIKYQTPAIQQLALFCTFKAECRGRNYLFYNGPTLDSVYELLTKPNAQIQTIYHDLKKLISNFMTITELKYQNEQVQIGCLQLAEAEDLDVTHIYELFKKPTEEVQKLYESILKKQAEYVMTQVAKWDAGRRQYGEVVQQQLDCWGRGY